MNGQAPAADPIGQAIAAAEAKDEPQPIAMRKIELTIGSTGRPAVLLIPADVTDGELAEVAGWMLTALMNTVRAERPAKGAGRIVVATRLPT